MILMPFERPFVRNQLGSLPIKRLTEADFESEVRELAASQTEMASLLNRIPDVTQRLFEAMDPADVEEALSALFGFYGGKMRDLGVRNSEAIDGIHAWATDCMGQTSVPMPSPRFLTTSQQRSASSLI